MADAGKPVGFAVSAPMDGTLEEKVARYLRSMATLVERGRVSAFQVTWDGSEELMSSIFPNGESSKTAIDHAMQPENWGRT